MPTGHSYALAALLLGKANPLGAQTAAHDSCSDGVRFAAALEKTYSDLRSMKRQDAKQYYLLATIHSTSMDRPIGSAATSTQVRAGKLGPIYSA